MSGGVWSLSADRLKAQRVQDVTVFTLQADQLLHTVSLTGGDEPRSPLVSPEPAADREKMMSSKRIYGETLILILSKSSTVTSLTCSF